MANAGAKSYGSVEGPSKASSLWEREYAEPWVILLNALGVVGYQFVSMALVAYQVLVRRNYIIICWHDKLPAWELWGCEFSKAFTRFFPLVAILISMSLVRSMVFIQRMYYELLRHGAVLRFKDYAATREPVFYVLMVCFVFGASNWLLELVVPQPDGVILYRVPELQQTKHWFVYLVTPITCFILSLYFTHEPCYTLVPLSRFLHGDRSDAEAAQARLAEFVQVEEEHVHAISEQMVLRPCETAEETGKAFAELIDSAREFYESGSVIVNEHRLTKAFSRNQITDRFWPAKFLLKAEFQDGSSQSFRRVSRVCDLCCVFAAGCCGIVFARCAIDDYEDVRGGEIEDVAALLVEAGHVAFALYYIAQICRSLL